MDDQRKDHIDPKGPKQRTAPNNYRHITCLLRMWKILTAQVREGIYNSLTSYGLFPEEQKGCRKGSKGTAELLYMDQRILNKSKTRRKNLAMAWIDYKKAYDMVPQSWMINYLKMYKISHEVINFIKKTIKTWRVELTAGGRSLAEAKIQRGIFQGDAISPLQVIIAMMPLNHILRKCTARYKLRSQEKINHLMYMDDIKLFAKNEKELETLIHAGRIYSQDIGMEFGIEKCAMLVMKSDKRHLIDEMELPSQDKIRTLGEKENYKYLHILEADTIKQVEMKDKIKKEYLRRTRKLLETKLSSRNLIKGINTWAVSLIRYSRPFVKWTREKLKQMDQRTRKLMTIHKTLHPRDDIDRLYVSRKEGERGLASMEGNVDASIRLKVYIEKHEGGLITAIRKDTDKTIENRMTITKKQKLEEKQLYGCFRQLINSISHEKTRTWLRKGNFKRETESLLIAAQNDAIRTNQIKARIDKT